jgi:hypothetical protein
MAFNLTEAKAVALVERALKVFPDEIEEEAKNALRDGLRAMKNVRQRDSGGQIVYVQVPDMTMRVAVAIKILEFNIGKPVNRTITADATPGGRRSDEATSRELLDLFLQNPEDSLAVYEKLREQALKAKKAIPVEVTVSPALTEKPKLSS